MTAWAAGTESFYGFTLRTSLTSSLGWKRFWSKNYSTASKRPYLEVWYEDALPAVANISPSPDGFVDTLTPTLWVDLLDPINTGTRQYKFKVCNGTPEAPAGCVDSGAAWLTSATWQVPAGFLTWGKESFWTVNVSNGLTESGWRPEWWFTPQVVQPPVTAHLAGANEGGDLPGVNPQVGNYSTATTDASIAVAGPALKVTRTYNSQDIRTAGAFGRGWSSPWDQRLQVDPDGSGNVVVTLPTGREVRFGRASPTDPTFFPPKGENLTLVYHASPPSWTLRDSSGYLRDFDASGLLTRVTDADGRTQSYVYSGGLLQTVTDAASSRALHVTWSNGHIATVVADPPQAGQPAPTWTYSYLGQQLVTCARRSEPGRAPPTHT
jgi:YD repeat-containing protein